MIIKLSKSKLKDIQKETPYFWMEKNSVPGIIGRPQKAMIELLQEGKITGKVLVIGDKTGDNALTLAKNGLKVLGIHTIPNIMLKASREADRRGLDIEFVIDDSLEINSIDEKFDVVFDAGFFHNLSESEALWFAIKLKRFLYNGGKYFITCFSNDMPGFKGTRGISREELYHTFREGWEIESIKEMDITTTFEDAKGWLVAVIRKY